METTYIKYSNLENYILTEVRKTFLKLGYLSAFDFFCIIIWKSNRAKSKIANRLLTNNSTLEKSVKDLSNQIFLAKSDKEKLRVLISGFGFRLPISSAILTLLYPDSFTIYDVRVCNTFPHFKGLDQLKFEKLWVRYYEFIEAVKNYGSQNLSLREKDKLLWGKSFYEQLNKDLKTNFKQNKDL